MSVGQRKLYKKLAEKAWLSHLLLVSLDITKRK
jgi:hypothetical protein